MAQHHHRRGSGGATELFGFNIPQRCHFTLANFMRTHILSALATLKLGLDILTQKVFADAKSTTIMAEDSDIAGFSVFLPRYKKALPLERTATEVL